MAEHNDDIVHFRKPGKALTTEEKWMVLHVLQRCKEARKHPERLPGGDSYQEVRFYTGVSKKVVVEIARYFKEHGTIPPPSRPGNSVNHQTVIDVATTALIRQHLLRCQRDGTPCQSPQIQTLLREQGRPGIHLRTIQRHIARLGFEYRQTTEGLRTLCEQPIIRQQRRAYLQQLQELSRAGYQIVYVDEFFCEPSIKGQTPAWGCLHALTEQGLLDACERVLERKKRHGGGAHRCRFAEFYDWFTNILCLKASSRTCFILDRAPYHFLPEEQILPERLSKAEMQSWLTDHNVHWEEHWLKSHVAHVLQSELDAMLLVRRVAAGRGHQVVLLPPAHPELNPFEFVWTTLLAACQKAPTIVAADMNAFVHTVMTTITPEICRHAFRQAQQFEEAYQNLDLESETPEFSTR